MRHCVIAALSLILAFVSRFALGAFEAKPTPAATIQGPGGQDQSQERILRPESNEAPGAPGSAEKPADLGAAGQTGIDDQIHIESPYGYLDYDEETNLIYGRERTKISYKGMTLEADRVIVDLGLEEAQAEGNVVLTRADQVLNCESMRYNFREGTGVAQNAKGKVGPLYFNVKERGGRPSFEQLSKNESLFRDVEMTSCDFPVPMYTFKAKEALVFQNERVLMRSATLRVRGIPVFYFPFYSRSIRGGTPWFFRVGYGKRSGAYIRVGYSYRHESKTPSWEDDEALVQKSRGRLDVFADYLSKRGPGAGLDYNYAFDFDRHTGQVQLYALADSSRNIESEQGSSRWQALVRHRSLLSEDISLQANIDAVSDPEVYYDVLDSFAESRRGRVPERRAQLATTLNREKYLARIRLEIKDRIGRNRFSDFSDPNDNNLDFDVQPGLEEKSEEGIPRDRWGRVSIKAPELNFASNDMRLGRRHLYYRMQLNLFNSLDRGLNTVGNGPFEVRDADGNIVYRGTDADAFVRGADLYQSLRWIHRFNERVTWLNQFGAGIGGAARGALQDDLVDGSRGFAPPGPILNLPGQDYPSDVGLYDGLYFTDPTTFHIGRSPELASYDDISSFFGYGDFMSRLNARFTDALQGFIRYTNRVTTRNYIGDWYASLGDQSIRSDLYNFPLRTHWIEGYLTYALLRPDINLYSGAGLNLTSAGSLWPNEDRWYYTPLGGAYRSASGRFQADSSLTIAEKQFYHPADPRAFLTNVVYWAGSTTYMDPSELWWVSLTSSGYRFLGNQLSAEEDGSLFEENDQRLRFAPGFGARIGPKWTVRGLTTYDSASAAVEDAMFWLDRDLHDALLALRIRLDRNVFGAQQQDGQDKNQGLLNNLDVSFTIQPKLPNAESPFRLRHRATLDEKLRPTELEG